MDNLSCHKTQFMINFYKNNQVNVILGPALSLDLNPIEYYFNILIF